MKTLTYKDFQASVEFDDGALFVKVLHIDDLLIAECDSASQAQGAFEELIDAYLADCVEEGRQPSKQFKGTFNVRMKPDLHRRVAMYAASQGVTLNAFVSLSLEEKLECSKLSERIESVISRSKMNWDAAAINQWLHRGVQIVDFDESYVEPRAANLRWSIENSLNDTGFEKFIGHRTRAKAHA